MICHQQGTKEYYMDTFHIIFMTCTLIALIFIAIQVWWEKKRGANVRDLQVSKRIVYRSLPILYLPIFFMQAPWKVRIAIVIVSLIIMQSYFIFVARIKRLLGTDKVSKGGYGERQLGDGRGH
jgi:hypothetical protein